MSDIRYNLEGAINIVDFAEAVLDTNFELMRDAFETEQGYVKYGRLLDATAIEVMASRISVSGRQTRRGIFPRSDQPVQVIPADALLAIRYFGCTISRPCARLHRLDESIPSLSDVLVSTSDL